MAECKGCGCEMALFINGKCHPEATVNAYMRGAVEVGGTLVLACADCNREVAEFEVSKITDLEKKKKKPDCRRH